MSVYDERPWLALYDEGQPGDLELEHPNVVAMFAAAAAAHGERPLIHYFGSTLTVDDVDKGSDALACALTDLGVRAGDRVAVYLQNVPQWMVSALAVWKAGAVVVPVNPMLKGKELSVILNDSGAQTLVTLQSLFADVAGEALPDTQVRTVITTVEVEYLDEVPDLLAEIDSVVPEGTYDLAELVAAHAGERPEPVTLGPDDLAMLTYTSGTTGPPKGAMNTHRNVVFNSQAYRDWMALTPDDVCLGGAPLFHITGLIGHLTVCMLTPMPLVLGYRFEPTTMLDLAERYGTTFSIMAITAFIAMLNAPGAEERDLSKLTKAYSGGAPIAPATVEAFEKAFGVHIQPAYGLTETTSPTHFGPMGRDMPVDENSGALSIGVPIYNCVVRIVDDERNELPPGEIGEFVASGPMVVPGYWNKPEETEHAIPGGALHTGDVGFMDEQGFFYIVDRKKDQINAAGYKVWPREVEDVLYTHFAVREAAVVGVTDAYRGETVKAFVSLKAGQSVEPDELIAFAKERMAAYKYPRQVEIIDELPKTVTGKILRRELRQAE